MSDLLSQAEIDALLNGIPNDSESTPKPSEIESISPANQEFDDNIVITPDEMDVLGEVGNISMGASATTLSTLINQEVNITTPKVDVMTWEELVQNYPKPYIVAKVEYTEGLIGTNLLIMKVEDIRILTNLMMGEEVSMEGDQLNELQLSAISEAMNQMIGSACTAVSSMVVKKIDITPPSADYVDFSSEDKDVYSKIYADSKIVKISFRMVVGDLIDSELMQLLPLQFAKDLVKYILEVQSNGAQKQESQPLEHKVSPQPTPQVNIQLEQHQAQGYSQVESKTNHMQMNQQPMNFRISEPAPREPVNVQPVQFQSLEDSSISGYRENIGLIMDVPLQVTVELGRATRMIRDILEFGPGSIVELDKLAGEPVDILVNGKIIAKGEVVVIDESFGVRITDIIHPSKRL